MAQEENKPEYSSVLIDGVKYETLLTKKYRERIVYTEPDPTKATAFIPGTIVKLHVSKNKKVKKGDIVITLEAMKMMNKVLSPVDGEVIFHVKKNDIVSKNQLLFEIVE